MKINEGLIKSIISSDLVNLTSDIGEAIIDSSFKDGILKDIPIIGVLVNLSKGVLSIKDRIFSRKILSFLEQLKDIPEDKRIKAIQKIDEDKEERIKVGEKIIYLIDRADDHIKAEFIGVLFSEYVKENLHYDDFKKCSELVNKAFLDDLLWVIKNDRIKLEMEDATELISSGLFDVPVALSIKTIKTRHDGGSEFVVKGYEYATINPFANLIRRFLKNKIE